MATLRYFAYGSNMLHQRLQQRVPSATVLGPADLPGHLLRFNKLSRRDGSGKANIVASENLQDIVHGVLYELEEGERPRLDAAEGLGKGYNLLTVRVRTETGNHSAFTYTAPPEATREHLKPYSWYKELVVAGAKENALPVDYIRSIEAIEPIEDPIPQ